MKPTQFERIEERRWGDRARRLVPEQLNQVALKAAALLMMFVVGVVANQSAAVGQDTMLSSKLSSAAPESCLSWYQWANPYNADAASENVVDRMMAEPDVNKFCKDFTDKLGQLPAVLIRDEAPPEIVEAAKVLGPQIVDGLLRKQGCFFIESFTLEEENLSDFKIGLVLEVGDNVDATLKSIESLLQMAGAPMETIKLDGQNGIKIVVPPDGPFSEIALGQHQGFLVAGTSTKMVQEIVARMKAGQVSGWLGQLQAEQKYVRAAAVGKIDVAALRNQLLPLAGDEAVKVVKALGFDNLDRVEFSGGFARTDFAQQFKLKFDGAPGGIFTAFDGKGLTASDISHFPNDSFFAVAMSADAKKILDEFNNILIQLDPNAAQEVARGFIEFQSETGVDLRKLLGNFGPTMTLHNGYGDGLLSGVQLRTELEDPKWFEKTVDDLMALVARETRTPARIDSIEQNGKTVKTLHFGFAPIPVEPSWFVDGNQMTLALFPSVLGSATNPDLAPRLIEEDSFAPYMDLFEPGSSDGKLIGFSYFESKWAYQMVYGYGCLGKAMIKNMDWSREMGVPEEMVARVQNHLFELQLPSCRSIYKHLTPEVSIIRKAKDAIVFESHSTMANANLTMGAPAVVAGLLLPAVQTVRSAARRTTSANNLRQCALAMHNYDSAFGEFPSGDGPVKEGGPAVSWRVKILPYIEQSNLYDMYNFDEPWDSEQNLKVAKLIPAVYQNPASNVPEGHTVYLGVGGTSGVMGVDAKGKSVSRGLADIVDGSSNTIMFVEVPDQMAVPWTKPDGGIDSEKTRPWQLSGNYPGGFNSAFCDGSVRFISEFVDAETFTNLLKYNDGNVVDYNDF